MKEVTKFFSLAAEGRDLARPEPARDTGSDFRSDIVGVSHEALPGISPLETRLGIRLHEPSPEPSWGVEFAARIVDDQDRVARTLGERPTPGFTLYDLRSFWRVRRDIVLTAGVENLTDKFYREHLDYRTGRSVFQPGISFYFGSEIFY